MTEWRLQRSRRAQRTRKLHAGMVVAVMLIGLIMVPAVASINAQSAQLRPIARAASPKDETVFANLASDGTVRDVYVINTFRDVTGPLADFGDYSAVTNLTDGAMLTATDGRIAVEFDSAAPLLYRYQGRLEQTALPWQFNFRYYLDGVPITAENLLGASGQLHMVLAVHPNRAAPLHFAEHYTVQVVVPLLVDRVSEVQAANATALLVGNRLTLAFTIMPGESYAQQIRATIRDFAMPRIEISAFRAATPQGEWREELETAFAELTAGLADMVAGTTALRSGLSGLHTGVKELHTSLEPLREGAAQFEAGLAEYSAGVTAFAQGLSQVQAGGEQLRAATARMNDHLRTIEDGYTAIAANLTTLLAGSSALSELATSLAISPDPAVNQLAQATLMQLHVLEQLRLGLEQANSGLAEYARGRDQIAQQNEAFSAGLGEVVSSAQSLQQGIDELAAAGNALLAGVARLPEGTDSLLAHTAILPGRVGELIAGQRAMLKGVTDARSELSQLLGNNEPAPVLSFVAPGRAKADSVQFVLVTPPIETSLRTPTPPVQAVKQSLWQRIVYLAERLFAFVERSSQ